MEVTYLLCYDMYPMIYCTLQFVQDMLKKISDQSQYAWQYTADSVLAGLILKATFLVALFAKAILKCPWRYSFGMNIPNSTYMVCSESLMIFHTLKYKKQNAKTYTQFNCVLRLVFCRSCQQNFVLHVNSAEIPFLTQDKYLEKVKFSLILKQVSSPYRQSW